MAIFKWRLRRPNIFVYFVFMLNKESTNKLETNKTNDLCEYVVNGSNKRPHEVWRNMCFSCVFCGVIKQGSILFRVLCNDKFEHFFLG